ncbi:MAG: MFS transporter [Bacillota bacterium]|nr:MFS transporter [Bacillota bacterium]MDI7250445.1 MFS transporter [Bacillota bacterium]
MRPPVAQAQAAAGTPGRWRALVALLAGTIMGPIDASIVNINLPVIAADLGATPDRVGWVSMAYLLVLGTLLLPFGRLGDILGLKRVYLAGLLTFVATSATCALAWTLGTLISLRALQALGAGMTMAMAPAIITGLFPPQERGRALGLNGMTVALGLSLGPTLGGWLADAFGWRSIFLVNVPVGLVAYFLCRRMLPPLGPREARRSFDAAGALLAYASLSCLLVSATRGPAGGRPLPFLALGAVGVALAALFIRVEKSSDHPMLDLSLFGNRIFSAGVGVAWLNFITQYVIVFVTPFYLQQVAGLRPGHAGTIMTALPLTVLVVAPLAGALSDRVGHRWPALVGLTLCGVGAAAMLVLEPHGGGAVAWRLSLFGLGTGLFQSPNNSAIMGAVPRSRLGVAGGTLATARNVGMTFGIALASTVLAVRQPVHAAAGVPQPFFAAVRDAWLAAAGVALIAILLQFCLVSVPLAGLRPHRGTGIPGTSGGGVHVRGTLKKERHER